MPDIERTYLDGVVITLSMQRQSFSQGEIRYIIFHLHDVVCSLYCVLR
jgi:hypothetical protein